MHDDPRLDDELAAFTDRLRADGAAETPPELAELAPVVRQLHRLIPPDVQTEHAFRNQLKLRLNREWTSQHQRGVSFWRSNRVGQLAALAAVVAVVLLAVVLVSTTGDDNAVEGTASGSVAGVAVAVAVLVGAGLLIAWFTRRR